MPHADFRHVLNSILWVTITGAKWRDLPKAAPFVSRSASHRWLLKWQRAISWMKRGYRRIATRWERLAQAYSGIILASLCYFWAKKIVG